MIISGYPCIGKSSLSEYTLKYIDLESSYFSQYDTEGRKVPGWEFNYSKMAIDLSERQHYDVFVSAHQEVRDTLLKLASEQTKLVTISPSIQLKDFWLEKLRIRWNITKSEKDCRAYEYAKDHYDESVLSLQNQKGFKNIIIDDVSYRLRAIVEGIG